MADYTIRDTPTSLTAFRDKYSITTTSSDSATRYPIATTTPKEVLDTFKNIKGPLNTIRPMPDLTNQVRGSNCYLYVTNVSVLESFFGKDNPYKKYYTQNDAGLGIWEFIITSVNIQHREAYQTSNVLSDTVLNQACGATPVVVNLSGFLLEDYAYDHVYNITFLFEKFLRSSQAVKNNIGLYAYLFGVMYHIDLVDILFSPGVSQGGYTPFRIAGHAYNVTIDSTLLSKPEPPTISYLTQDEYYRQLRVEEALKDSYEDSRVDSNLLPNTNGDIGVA